MAKKSRSQGARAVATGAGSGIGRAFALELARRGGAVVCADINLETAADTVSCIEAAGGRALAVRCDVTVLEQVEALADRAEQWFGAPTSLLVNNAGVGIGGQRIGEFSIEDWRWTVDINQWGMVYGCHVFVPRLRELGEGGVINVCSTASFAAAPLMGPYNMTKAAVLALSETLAAELSETRIGVTALCPTFVKTNIIKDGRLPADASKLSARLMAATGMSPERVVRDTLKALDRGRLYVLPQIDARMIWRAKRLAPRSYQRLAALALRAADRFQ